MTIKWVSRNDLGLAMPNPSHLQVRPGGGRSGVIGVTVHWTVTPNGNPHSTWKAIQHDEMTNKGYGDISYNAGVTDQGEILEGRSPLYVGAHALAHGNIANLSTYGVAYVGNGEPTGAAIDALKAYIFVVILSLRLGHPIILPGHQDWLPFGGIPTACPGTMERIVRDIRRQIGAPA